MKAKICISIDEETLFKVQESLRNRRFRNKSHAFEFAVNQVLEEVPK